MGQHQGHGLVRGSFKKVWLRGSTDFSLTEHFDRWSVDKVGFVFGIDAMPSPCAIAEGLEEGAWKPLATEALETRIATIGGRKVTKQEMKEVRLERNEFQGQWNYTIRPRTK